MHSTYLNLILTVTLLSLPSWACLMGVVQSKSMCTILAGFYVAGKSTAPPSWICIDQIATEDPCTWAGVVCDAACNLIALNLGNAGIGGTLSASIGNLATLQNILLYGNSIGGSMPVQIGNLQNLQMFEIDHNRFTGRFPEICNYYGSRADFNLAVNNQYYGPPNPSFLGLISLTLFQADHNQFSCMPACFYAGRLQTVAQGLWSMPSTDYIHHDPGVPKCASKSHTQCVHVIPLMRLYCVALKPTSAPTHTAKPSYTRAPTTRRPTASPTTSAQFKWRSNMKYYDGKINVNTTYLYNVFYGNWGANQISRCPYHDAYLSWLTDCS
jgi:hypothetical protein